MNQTKVRQIYNALEDKKAANITVIDISDISVMADCFIIADGESHTQVQALADNVQETLDKEGCHCKSISGYRSAGWILMDYQDVVVHIFYKEDRLFYDLERLWRDGKRVLRSQL